jgi:hypothetical protein
MGYEGHKLSTFCEMPISRVTLLAMTARLDSIEWYCKYSGTSQSTRIHYILCYLFEPSQASYNGLACTKSIQCYYKQRRLTEII